jgi:hypothetical protein
MRRLLLAFPFAALFLVGSPAPAAPAPDEKTVQGRLTAMAADSVMVKVGMTEMTFAVDNNVHVIAPGAGTKTRKAASSGKMPKLGELLHTGDAVEVSYRDAGGSRLATIIRMVPSAGSAGVPSNTSEGTITAVSPSSLSISGSNGGGSTFSQTFVIDERTKVIGKGIGTAVAKTGGKAAATDLLAAGDHVSVSFRPDGARLHATEVRVSARAVAKNR